MAEQTDWYERGCSRGCRNEHTRVWGWCDLAEEPAPTLNLSIAETFTASDGNTSVKIRQATVDEARAELAKFETPPDWADLREAARKAGWTPEGRLSWWTWTRRDNRGSDLSTGWALVQWTGRSISLVGPGNGPRGDRSAADLIDPTPARVLAIARELGIGDPS